MPTLKSSLIKPSKSMLFFHIWNANFSVTPINSQMYMTKPKQVQKKLSENTGKTFSVIMPSFTCRGWAYLRKLLYCDFKSCYQESARKHFSWITVLQVGRKRVDWYEEIWLIWYPYLEYGVGLWILWIGLGWAPLGWWDWTGWSRVAAGLIGRATECLRRAYRPCLGTVRLHSAYHGLERASLPLGVDLYKDKC